MPQSYPTTGPARFLSPIRFLARKAEWSAVGILRRCCSRGHIRLRAPYDLTRLYAYGLVEWFAGSYGFLVRCPYGHRAGPARESSRLFVSYGFRAGSVRDSQGCRTAPLRTGKVIDTTRIGKNPARASYLAVWGPARAVHGLITISKPVRGP